MHFGEILLKTPDNQLDESMKVLIEKWGDPPKAIQVLEVLDHCIHGSLANGVVVRALQIMYEAACKNEGVTHEDLVPLATWRRKG